ncbi:ABC-2 transporter permease [Peptoniphilus asaccharolyticus]
MKALMLKDFYILRKTLIGQLFIILFSQLYFIIDMFRHGIKPDNVLSPSILIQILFVMSIGGMILTEGTENVREYLRATPITSKDYLKSKLISQIIAVVFISFVEMVVLYLLSNDLKIVKLIALTSVTVYLTGLLYIFMVLKLGQNYVTVIPIGLFFIVFMLSKNYPQLVADFVNGNYMVPAILVLIGFDLILSKLAFGILVKELENYE